MEFINSLNIDWERTIIIVSILLCGFIISRTARWIINRSFITASKKIKVDPTRYKFFKNAISFIIWLLVFGFVVYTIPQLRSLAITLFAGAGILLAILGLAAQQAFSNIISGVFIVIFKPFRVGDLIKVGTLDYGVVEDITLRHTVIISFENKRIIIPNSTISSETIVNDMIGDENICKWIEIGISYDSDIDLATKIIQEAALSHKDCIDVRSEEQKRNNEPIVEVRLISFGDFSVNLRGHVWTNDAINARLMQSDLHKIIKKRFDAEGIEIPFPYRTIVYKNDLPSK